METQRERSKSLRRQLILESAELLIRKTGGVEFSMSDLAQAAGLSLATAYNLIGSKSTVLYALLNRRADEMLEVHKTIITKDTNDAYIKGIDISVKLFTQDPSFYRPLMKFLIGVSDPVQRGAFMERGQKYWTMVACAACDDETSEKTKTMGRLLHLVFTGALVMWIHEEITEEQFIQEIVNFIRMTE